MIEDNSSTPKTVTLSSSFILSSTFAGIDKSIISNGLSVVMYLFKIV